MQPRKERSSVGRERGRQPVSRTLKSLYGIDPCTHHHVNVVHKPTGGQSLDPVGDQRATPHRQERLSDPRQVSELPAAVRGNVPLEPRTVAGGENHSLH